jgi:hypothetical protein
VVELGAASLALAVVRKRMNKLPSMFLAVSFGFLTLTARLASGSSAAPPPFELATEHAGLAAKAVTVTAIHEHLQRTLNCLEGNSGQDFKPTPGNPCTGRGAVEMLPKDSADLIRTQKSIVLARVGVTLHDRAPAHYVAEAIHAILTEGQR